MLRSNAESIIILLITKLEFRRISITHSRFTGDECRVPKEIFVQKALAFGLDFLYVVVEFLSFT